MELRPTILVTGANGRIGSEVVKQLSDNGIKCRAMVRGMDRSEPLAKTECEIVVGDFRIPETLEAAMSGIERIFLLSPSEPDQIEMEGNAVIAAKKAGVRHIVKLSVMGASAITNVLISQWHYYCEKLIEESGLTFTHVRPTSFMQNFLMDASTIRNESVFYGALGDSRVSYVDIRDIAAVAAASLTKDGHEDKIYEITGPEAITPDECAEKISSAVGRPIKYVNISEAAYRQGMIDHGIPDWLADDLTHYYKYYKEGHAQFVTHWIGRVTGRQPFMFEAFACDHTWAFR